MRIINPSVELIPSYGYKFEDIKKDIERAGRTSYASSDKITDNSYERFYDMITNNGHDSVLEFGTVYLAIPKKEVLENILTKDMWYTLSQNPYTTLMTVSDIIYITTNMRVLLENKLVPEILNYITEPTKFHPQRFTFKFILSRGIADEFARHRGMSICMQSTRYCNYSKDRFNHEITFVNSQMIPLNEGVYNLNEQNNLIGDGFILDFNITKENINVSQVLATIYFMQEAQYFLLLEKGVVPQIARNVLSLGVKTELIMCGNLIQWGHFFKLRCSNSAHPDAKFLAEKARNILLSK